MSKKYDEYLKECDDYTNNVYPKNRIIPMIPAMDEELQREIRDRAIIDLVFAAAKSGYALTYGDVRRIVDHDISEKEYEESKKEKALKLEKK